MANPNMPTMEYHRGHATQADLIAAKLDARLALAESGKRTVSAGDLAWGGGRFGGPKTPRGFVRMAFSQVQSYNYCMEAITRDISDLAADERNLLERFVGTHLTENQRIVVQVLDADVDGTAKLPRTAADYAILADLDDAEANELTEAITQRSPGRDFAL